MNASEIIEKANKAVNGATFTKVIKPIKEIDPSFLIVVTDGGLALYGSYLGDTTYAVFNNQCVQLA